MAKKHEKKQIALAVLSILGILIMGYLVSLHFSEEEGSFCDLGKGLSCDIVNKSEYSEVAGIPVSMLGIFYFIAVFFTSIFKYDKKTLKKIAFITIAFLGPSLYLTIIELTVIKSICVFCEGSKILMTLIAITAWKGSGTEFKKNHFVSAVVVAILLALLTWGVHSSVGPGDKYNEFAQCLDEKGFLMYGSITCSFCLKQRGLFGDAFQYIKEIECDPRNPHPEVERCVAKNIEHTPTWIQEREDGSEIYRFDPGVQSFKKLSEISGCKLPE
ncbi:MAG: hypothetical protein COV29_01500 [Candidatus Yanofskybacteria bacterium CG10_big_fil_rev_8_21_14_0_10_36_16]|uniref:Vitamin K epoxide reductase domain-containing protein n=1 Tax=Candidatus Yanofskybacteria bacterium CG10_big_fil_rev_8_21_14_0_10_36_16 TaxID=1975096 RepID=A0A2J0Q7D6_9BACT|nr:MAG: hypothetical protein COV29_01500 [Candidatus Yanofskybacteria bacterium CG10_big_fil_rev_8_21_14_0_10_36_16]